MYQDQWVEWAKPSSDRLNEAYRFLLSEDYALAKHCYESLEASRDREMGLAVLDAIDEKYHDAATRLAHVVNKDDPDPNDFCIAAMIGDFLLLQGKFKGAEICYCNALDLQPGNHSLWQRAGNAAFLKEDYQRAVEYLRKAGGPMKELAEARFKAQHYPDAMLDYKQLLRESEFDAFLMMRYGQAAYGSSRENYQKSLQQLSSAINFNPDLGEAYFARAAIQWDRLKTHGDISPEDIIKDLDLAKTKQIDAGLEAAVYLLHAEILQHIRRPLEASGMYKAVLETDIEQVDAWYGLSECLRDIAVQYSGQEQELLIEESEELADIAERLLDPDYEDWIELEQIFDRRQEQGRASACFVKANSESF